MLQVKAMKLGYYEHKRRRVGVAFTINSEKDFSETWMEPIGWTPKPRGKKHIETKEQKIARLKAELSALESPVTSSSAVTAVLTPAPDANTGSSESANTGGSGDETVI